MELRHIRYFVAVAEEQHFSRAAERAGIEQSPLSRAIRILERDLGARLFDRSSRGTRITAAGEDFLPHARRILASVDQARRDACAFGPRRANQLRVGLDSSMVHSRAGELLSHAGPIQTEFSIAISYASARELCGQLSYGHLDCALSMNARPPEGLVAMHLWSDPLVLVLPAAHPLAAEPKWDFGDLQGDVPIYSSVDLSSLTVAGEGLGLRSRHGTDPQVQVVPNLDLLMTLVGNGFGLGITTARECAADRHPNVVLIPCADPNAKVTTSFLRKPGPISPSVASLLGVARTIE